MVRNFMLTIGPISSIYDFLTFYVLLHFFHASQPEFHTGWFVESLATQTLVIFVIRTAGNPLKSRPSLPLAITTILIVATGVFLPYSPLHQAVRIRSAAGPVLCISGHLNCDLPRAGRVRQADAAPGMIMIFAE